MCAAGAPLLLAAAAALVLLGALAGFHPLWQEHELNLAEAAALRDSGLIVRLIQDGRDPNEPLYIRPDMLTSEGVRVTPAEAAVGARRLEVLQLLLSNGATLDGTSRRTLICLARKHEADDIVEYLVKPGTAESVVDCGNVKLPW